jgi:hypothetical protein
VHSYVFREPHRLQHLWSEHTAVADLDPSIQHGVEGKDFQGGLIDMNKYEGKGDGQDILLCMGCTQA